MPEPKMNTFFVSEKIAKVRWVPEKLKESERFLTGSFDMPLNYLRIWRLQQNQFSDDDYIECTPKCSDKLSFAGDVTGVEFISDDTVAVSGSDGYVTMVKVNRAVELDTLQEVERSQLLHKFTSTGKGAPCTAISVYGKDVATVGEDGRLNIVDTLALHQVRRSIEADSCALLAVAYVNPQEVLIANRMGVIRMFDIRASAEATPTTSFMTSCEDDKCSNFVSCLASYPTQAHIVLAASEEGSITVWDLRQPGLPASYLSAHTSAITEIGFHRTDPKKLFSAAESGELWLWAQHPTMDGMDLHKSDNLNPWLNGERAKSRINVTSLISNLRKSINSVDAHDSKIICGGDTEAIYLIDNML